MCAARSSSATNDHKVLFRSVSFEFATNFAAVGDVYRRDQEAMLYVVNPKVLVDAPGVELGGGGDGE